MYSCRMNTSPFEVSTKCVAVFVLNELAQHFWYGNEGTGGGVGRPPYRAWEAVVSALLTRHRPEDGSTPTRP